MSALVALVMMTGCGDSDSTSTDDGVRVVAAFYPLEEIVRGVGGDHVVYTRVSRSKT